MTEKDLEIIQEFNRARAKVKAMAEADEGTTPVKLPPETFDQLGQTARRLDMANNELVNIMLLMGLEGENRSSGRRRKN